MIWSDGQVRMNGRLAGGGQPVWSGDLLEAVSSASNQVFIESVGQVSLMSNARVRLSLGATAMSNPFIRCLWRRCSTAT
jgi:hypothetical protein